MTFANPEYLFLLLLLLPIVGWYIYELRKSDASVQVSDTRVLAAQPKSIRIWLLHVPFVLRIAVITLISIALARPQLTNKWSSQSTEGIDIMMALDISGTMLAEDLRPNRLEAAKKVASDFVIARPNDQIGLVVFAGESFTQCPLTTDHAVLVNLFKSVEYGMVEDGTAIGLGLANAVNRMKDSETKSKVIILLTDGSNNRGDIDPQTAAEIAKTYGIRVYTIGVGSYGQARVPVQTPIGKQYITMDNEFDETTLRSIAETTGGQYFRAKDNTSLKAIYDQIDQMEKTKLRVREFSKHTENFMPFLYAALICLLLELIIRYFVLRTISN
ncbi:MAG: VWA domain-containing protein [Paludibacteraceae bacterium]|jgi:Ca-activated chloride channel family protein|nr:VWA domain-containing protein [Paludibacteraceae bacterium]MCI6420405.1 VWA domain-containing protein [Bacteroidales bacterium]MBQ7381656.1 VWA domain-containing protein [Paludibacteraceae bacterium]MDD5991128.1 VWA domain-containing protein [Paludibacteraceae bacterium]MDD6747918.1 VWA domain-containing protein [Paludibacteraceae bacterium]